MMVVGEEVEVEEEDKEERLYDAMFFFRAILAMEIFANVDNDDCLFVGDTSIRRDGRGSNKEEIPPNEMIRFGITILWTNCYISIHSAQCVHFSILFFSFLLRFVSPPTYIERTDERRTKPPQSQLKMEDRHDQLFEGSQVTDDMLQDAA